MKCPHCTNDDPRLIELLATLTYVFPVAYKYFCINCSKTFISEESNAKNMEKRRV